MHRHVTPDTPAGRLPRPASPGAWITLPAPQEVHDGILFGAGLCVVGTTKGWYGRMGAWRTRRRDVTWRVAAGG